MNNPAAEIHAVALEIFSKKVSGVSIPEGREDQVAASCYRLADAFLRTKAKMLAGEMDFERPKGVQLDIVCCPNKPPTDPLNLVSQQFGNIATVQKVHAWLNKNPLAKNATPEDEQELVDRFNRDFKFGWSMSEINCASIVFPTYCPKA